MLGPGALTKVCVCIFVAGVYLPGVVASAATLKPLVAGKRGVVAAGHPLVAEAGPRILEKGGNVVDAGVATLFAASVVELASFGSEGECPILIKMKNAPVVAINGDGIAPELATAEFYENLRRDDPRLVTLGTIGQAHGGIIPSFGPLSAIVPSAMDSILLALERYGTMKLGEVIQPAIELAQGCPLDDHLATAIAHAKPVWEKWPTTSEICMPGGHLVKGGELFYSSRPRADLSTSGRG